LKLEGYMSENDSSKSEVIARSVERIANAKGIESIGNGLGSGLVAFALALAAAAFFFGVRWDGRLHAQEKCFDLKEISGKLIQINNCTGEAKEVKLESSKKD
jgi:hypothetical protein